MSDTELRLFPDERWTISGLQRSLRSGETTCEGILQHCLEQVDRWESKIQAWVRLDREGALTQARELDQQLKAGHWFGPLHGIPMGIKDLFDWEGWPTAAGFPPYANRMAARDSVVVGILRQSGAVLMGKTVTTQFASFDPPITKNPWKAGRTPGGSSSGSAAAVATGMCIAAIGSQTGGSITRPASFCGVAGCKPTFHSVSLEGCFPFTHSLDHPGPMAKSVRDLAVITSHLCDHLMTTSEQWLELDPQVPPRIRQLRGLFEERADPECRELVQRGVKCWETQQAKADDRELPTEFAPILTHHRMLMATEAADIHHEVWQNQPGDMLPKISSLLEEGNRSSAVDFLASRRHQTELKKHFTEWFGDAEILVCPATAGGAPGDDSTGDPCMNSPWSYLGLPTVNFPLGLDRDGLPLGVQLVARPGEEDSLFRAALWCEKVWRREVE
ncbi:MAG: amidase [Planctomycetaceae bacterium]|nr:amidase [Planctomycetaceae bacterium]